MMVEAKNVLAQREVAQVVQDRYRCIANLSLFATENT
jgi:hypothetical protein